MRARMPGLATAQAMPDAGARHRRVLVQREERESPAHTCTARNQREFRRIEIHLADRRQDESPTGQIADKTNRRPVGWPLEALRTNMRRSAFRPRLVLQHSSIMTGHDACGVASIRAQRIPPYVATDSSG